MKISVYKNTLLLDEKKLVDPIDGLSLTDKLSDFFLGRASNCQICLDDISISRQFAKIYFDSDKHSFTIEKLSPLGQMFINGANQSKGLLSSGDVINIGPFTIKIEDIKIQTTSQVREIERVKDETENILSEESTPIEEVQEIQQENAFDDFSQPQDEFIEQNVDQMGEQNDESLGEKTNEFEAFAKFYLKIKGPYAPYDSYELNREETIIGRDKSKSQIILMDPDVSSIHAVIKKNGSIITIVDLKSSNGTIVNGERVNEKELGPQDEILIGTTSFVLTISSDLLAQESQRLMPVAENQEIEIEEIVEEEMDFSKDENSQESATFQNASAGASSLLKDPNKRRFLIYGLVGIVLLIVMFLPDEENQPANKKDEKQVANSKSSTGASSVENEKLEQAKKTPKRIYTPEERETMEVAYNTAKAYFYEGKLNQAQRELEVIFALNPSGDYKQTLQLNREIIAANKEIAALQEKKRKEEEEIKKEMEIKALLEKAKSAVKDNQFELAKTFINQILERDPENIDVVALKMEMDSIEKEKEKVAVEQAQKKSERERRVGQLTPGKNAFLKKEWYKAINKLEEFLKINLMDEDLIVEATSMLETSKTELANAITPLLEKAKSAYNGNDLLESFNNFKEVLEIDPSNEEAMNKINAINETLENRAKKIYREALIAESLSMFSQAYEKFQEVKEVSPKNSEYYLKATEKLKNFLGEN